jgi:hypothetical protein
VRHDLGYMLEFAVWELDARKLRSIRDCERQDAWRQAIYEEDTLYRVYITRFRLIQYATAAFMSLRLDLSGHVYSKVAEAVNAEVNAGYV